MTFLPLFMLLFAAPQEPAAPKDQRPLSPEEGEQAWRVQPGFRVELVAAEPHVVDPVAMAFDEDGRIYAAEMLDFPINRAPGMFGPFPEGQIRLIQLDERGKAKRSTIFARAIPAPTSVLPFDGGVLVSAAPDILFFKDTDGDGYADVRKVVLTGFDTGDDLYRVNSLQWGVDGWIYARGRGNTPVRWGDDPTGAPLSTQNMDFRFRPREKSFEAVSGRSGCFGLTMDDFGRRFYSDSAHHVHHVVLPNRYLSRNPFLAAPPLTREISDHEGISRIHKIAEPRAWRLERSAEWSRRKDLKGSFWNIEFRQDYMTATCGPKIYRESAFPADYQGTYFVCDAVGNVVHRDLLREEGASYVASRAHEKTEFMASTDPWCSPVFCETGPDGALYVCDMYRLIIEHPEYRARDGWSNVPIPILQKYGMRSGSTSGRIYRAKPEGSAYRKPSLGTAGAPELAAALASPDAWWRNTAQRLILGDPARADRAAIDAAADAPSPGARVQALWTLEALGALGDARLRKALADAHPGVRENALMLAESRPALADAVLARVDDPAARVRFQLALSIGEVPSARRPAALAALARRDGGNVHFRAAILSSVVEEPVAFLREALDAPPAFLGDLARMIGARLDPAEISRAAALGEKPEVLAGLAAGIRQRRRIPLDLPGGRETLDRLLAHPDPVVKKAAGDLAGAVRTLTAAELEAVLARARAAAAAEDGDESARAVAVRTLASAPFAEVSELLSGLLHPRRSETLQGAALETLDAMSDPGVVRIVAARWRTLTPALREKALRLVTGRTERLQPLLEAVGAGEIPASSLDASRRAQLLAWPDPAVAAAARKVLVEAQPDPAVFDRHKPALGLAGDPKRGEVQFRKLCLSCHRAGGEGTEVGPALTSVREHPKDQILRNILFPSLSVLPGYAQYLVETADGQIVNGILLSAGAASVTLRRQNAPDLTILRKDIRNLVSSPLSVMPEGLLKELAPQEVADLLEFVKQVK